MSKRWKNLKHKPFIKGKTMNTQVLDFIEILKLIPPKGDGTAEVWITFRTDNGQVYMPKFIRDKYPNEITIVMEYQYSLQVQQRGFTMMLSFNDAIHKFYVPYEAVESFHVNKIPDKTLEEKAVQNNNNVISITNARKNK